MGELLIDVPPSVAADLSAGEEERAGEWLRSKVEIVARSTSEAADPLFEYFSSIGSGMPLLHGYIEWSKGIVAHLDGASTDAVVHLKSAEGIFNGRRRRDLGDRVGLLLVDVFGGEGDLESARRLARRLRISFVRRGDRVREAVVLAALAGAEDAGDHVARAGELWREALSGLPPDDFRTQIVRANLANVAMTEGRLDVAIRGHRKIAEIAVSLGLDRLELQAETNLAEAEFLAGRIDSALDRWQGVIDRARRDGRQFEEDVAQLELVIAEAEMGDRKAAAQNLVGLERRFRDAGLLSEAARARRVSGLIEAGASRGSWRSAFDDLVSDGQIVSAHLLRVDVASAFGGVASEDLMESVELLRHQGLVARALVAEALAAREAALSGRHDEASTLALSVVGNRGATPWARMVARHALSVSMPEGAGRHLAAAIKIADGLLGKLASAADRSAFLNLRKDIYLESIARLLDRGRARDRHRALDLVHRFSSGWLLDELGRRDESSADPEIRRWVGLRRQLAALLAEYEGESEPRIRRSGLRVRDRLREIEGEIEGVERVLERRWSGSILTGRTRDVGARLKDRLGPGHCLLEILPKGNDLMVFVVRRDGLEARCISGVGPVLRRLVASARFHLDARPWLENGRGEQMDRALESTLGRLGRILLDGVDLEGVDTLWVAPHGLLYGIPWAGLSTSDGTRLLDHVTTVTVVPGSAVAARLLESYGEKPARFGFAGAPVKDLPEVSLEMQDLKRIVPDSEVVTDSDRASFMKMLKDCDAVHLAGHAVFLDGLPAASGLRMRDGFITVHDLAASRLNTQFVSFGVCSGTRITESDPTRSEGFLRALMAGGVRTVVGAVSPVRDDVARIFSTALYQGLTEQWAPGEAWRAAVEAVRNVFPSPAFWGSFQIFGDPRTCVPDRATRSPAGCDFSDQLFDRERPRELRGETIPRQALFETGAVGPASGGS